MSSRQESVAVAPLAPPPGLGDPLDPTRFGGILGVEAFAARLRERPLPASLENDSSRRTQLELAVLSCVEGLYRDRIPPTLAELRARLGTSAGVGGSTTACAVYLPEELRAILILCARATSVFAVLPPDDGQPARVLLQCRPESFQGWVDPEAMPVHGEFLPEVWPALYNILGAKAEADSELPLGDGDVYSLALALHRHTGLPQALRKLSAGELHRAVRLAMSSEPEGILNFSPQDGRRVVLRAAAPPEATLTTAGGIIDSLLARPLVEERIEKDGELLGHLCAKLLDSDVDACHECAAPGIRTATRPRWNSTASTDVSSSECELAESALPLGYIFSIWLRHSSATRFQEPGHGAFAAACDLDNALASARGGECSAQTKPQWSTSTASQNVVLLATSPSRGSGGFWVPSAPRGLVLAAESSCACGAAVGFAAPPWQPSASELLQAWDDYSRFRAWACDYLAAAASPPYPP